VAEGGGYQQEQPRNPNDTATCVRAWLAGFPQFTTACDAAFWNARPFCAFSDGIEP
jgi:hypothetical protein